MSRIYPSLAVLVLALVSPVGGDYESRAAEDTNLIRVAEMQKAFRDLWLGHIFLIQHVVLYNAATDPAARDAADKQVLANAKQIANTFIPFYGQARSEKLFALLSGHYGAVKEYSEATIAENTASTRYCACPLGIQRRRHRRVFQRNQSPHLPKDTVRGLIAAHGAHHVLQINQYKKKEYAKLEETWSMMRQHVVCHCGYARDSIGEAVSG